MLTRDWHVTHPLGVLQLQRDLATCKVAPHARRGHELHALYPARLPLLLQGLQLQHAARYLLGRINFAVVPTLQQHTGSVMFL